MDLQAFKHAIISTCTLFSLFTDGNMTVELLQMIIFCIFFYRWLHDEKNDGATERLLSLDHIDKGETDAGDDGRSKALVNDDDFVPESVTEDVEEVQLEEEVTDDRDSKKPPSPRENGTPDKTEPDVDEDTTHGDADVNGAKYEEPEVEKENTIKTEDNEEDVAENQDDDNKGDINEDSRSDKVHSERNDEDEIDNMSDKVEDIKSVKNDDEDQNKSDKMEDSVNAEDNKSEPSNEANNEKDKGKDDGDDEKQGDGKELNETENIDDKTS